MPHLKTRNTSPIPILTYHQIAEAPPEGTPYRSLVVDPEDFARQMAFLRLMGYQGLSMSALLPYLRGEKVGKVVGITFDDGYLNNLTNALPALRRNGFSATCYVVSQLIGHSNEWDLDVGVPSSTLMDALQLRAWVAGGQEVGAHTRNHVHLNQLDDKACLAEIAGCKLELEKLTGGAVTHFCYPYGEFETRHVQMVRNHGYLSATTTQRSRSHAGEDMMRLPRVPVARRTTLLALWMKLRTRYEDKKRV
jgi:peptidoglycan/xylan/chitin deacetylase (PgdA/CDA1 family)